MVKFGFQKELYEKILEEDKVRLCECASRDLLRLKQGKFDEIFEL